MLEIREAITFPVVWSGDECPPPLDTVGMSGCQLLMDLALRSVWTEKRYNVRNFLKETLTRGPDDGIRRF